MVNQPVLKPANEEGLNKPIVVVVASLMTVAVYTVFQKYIHPRTSVKLCKTCFD